MFDILFNSGKLANKWSVTYIQRQRRTEGGIELPIVDSDFSFCRLEIISGQKAYAVEKIQCLTYCFIQESQ